MARASNLSSLSFQQLQSELRRRARRAATLQRRRDRVARRIAALDDRIAELGGSANGRVVRHGGRPQNEKPLAESLHAVLIESKPMRVTDLAQAVQKAGYRTSGKSFRTQVNIALVKRKDLFKRVGRGEYAAK